MGKCGTCKFWCQEGKQSRVVSFRLTFHECRRNPPYRTVIRKEVDGLGIWPMTSQKSWCGEYQPQQDEG